MLRYGASSCAGILDELISGDPKLFADPRASETYGPEEMNSLLVNFT